MADVIQHPNQLIRATRTSDLQNFLVHGIFTAGKTAAHANAALERFYEQNPGRTPFSKIRKLIARRMLKRALKKARVGNYEKNTRALRELVEANLNLRTCSVDELERIYGISRKTSRYFVLYTRPKARVAALDVHMLKFLRVLKHKAPKDTPSSLKVYNRLQDVVLKLADKAGMTPAELDYAVWTYYAQREPLPDRLVKSFASGWDV